MKVTGYKSNGIKSFVAHSPSLDLRYRILIVRQLLDDLEFVEASIAIVISLQHLLSNGSAIGSTGAVPSFLISHSCLLSTPDWEPSAGGFPAISTFTGQFLLKDPILARAAIFLLAEAATPYCDPRPSEIALPAPTILPWQDASPFKWNYGQYDGRRTVESHAGR